MMSNLEFKLQVAVLEIVSYFVIESSFNDLSVMKILDNNIETIADLILQRIIPFGFCKHKKNDEATCSRATTVLTERVAGRQ